MDGQRVDAPLPTIVMKRANERGRDQDEEDGGYYGSRGYVYVRASCRGSFSSEGAFYPYVNDGADGYDLIEWVSRQPWSDGKVATDGGIALGIHAVRDGA